MQYKKLLHRLDIGIKVKIAVRRDRLHACLHFLRAVRMQKLFSKHSSYSTLSIVNKSVLFVCCMQELVKYNKMLG